MNKSKFGITLICIMTIISSFNTVFASEIIFDDNNEEIECSIEAEENILDGIKEDFSSELITSYERTDEEAIEESSNIDENEAVDAEKLHAFNRNYFDGVTMAEDISVYSTTWAIIPVSKTQSVVVTSNDTVPGASTSKTKLLQCCLNYFGYNAGTADGIYGTNTKNDIMKFQSNNGLTADGVAGEKTWRKMDVKVDSYGAIISSYLK